VSGFRISARSFDFFNGFAKIRTRTNYGVSSSTNPTKVPFVNILCGFNPPLEYVILVIIRSPKCLICSWEEMGTR